MRVTTRFPALLVVVVAVAVALGGCSNGGSRKSTAATAGRSAGATTTAAPAHVVLRIAEGRPLPTPLSREVALPDGNGVMLLGGLGSAGTSTSGVYRLDPATGSASRVGTLSQAVHDAAGAVVGDAFLVFGGGEQHTVDAVQSFVPGQPARVVGHLPQPRSDLVTATVGGHVYVLAGFDGTRGTSDVLDTTDGVHFSVLARLPHPVRYPAVAVTDHRIWLFGGEEGSADIDAIQVVDVEARTAQVVGHLANRLAHASAVVVGGRVVVAGGRLDGSPTNRTWLFDPATAGVTDGPPIPRPLLDAAAVAVGDTGYLLGGESPKPVSDVLVLRFVAG